MLRDYLNNAISILDQLIAITNDDIENIKQAKHSAVQKSVEKKSALIKEFEQAKSDLDKELVRMSKETSSEIGDVIDEETKEHLVLMREKLESLNKVNKEYSKQVVAVKEFFDTLVKEMFDIESNEYGSLSASNKIFKAKV